jgi:hypothetical protein
MLIDAFRTTYTNHEHSPTIQNGKEEDRQTATHAKDSSREADRTSDGKALNSKRLTMA